MRTRADVLSDLIEAQTKKPTSWGSSMARIAKISQLKAELNAFDEGLTLQDPITEIPALILNKKIEFVIDGYKVTVEPC